MKILFSGGGTLGPVTPLLAMHEVIKKEHPDASFLWIGTTAGPERALIEQAGIPFFALNSGKFRRYLSIWNVTDMVRIFTGFFRSLRLLWRHNPDVCISAGGYISVPLHWAAFFLGIPTWIHQQDVKVGLANKLMVPVARMVTVALERHLASFPKRKTHWLGNPVRSDLFNGSRAAGLKRFGLRDDLPVVFATGGGTGSLRINQLIVEAIPHLKGHCQVIHLSGLERPQELVAHAVRLFSDYYQVHQFFTEEMKDAYASADIVLSRGGFGTLTEIAALGKAAIIIPKPGHQVLNVEVLEAADAVISLNERVADGLMLARVIKEVLHDNAARLRLERNLQKMLPRAKNKTILELLEKTVGRQTVL